jgi:AraC-like DNA-binding protein/quercetin dioxygenase-like cupin family protein
MSRKRQSPIYNPQGRPAVQLTTLSYTFADGHIVQEHFHKEDQLLFASKGVMTIRTGNGIWVVPPLRAVWIPGNEIHSIVMAGSVLMRTLYFAPKFAEATPRKCFVLNVSSLFRELILHACTKPAWKIRIAEEGRIIEVLLDQLKLASTIPLQLPEPKDSRAARVVEILIGDPSDPRTLGELCKGTGGSKRTIERAFLDDTGMTFGKWRQQLRLLHGMRLLAAGEKVTVAALESGYNSPSAFIAVFKKALGHTPHQYLGLHT